MREGAFRYVAVVTVLTALAVMTGSLPALRLPLVVLFAATCPGLGWAGRLKLSDLGDRVAVAVALSVSATVIVSQAMALVGVWSAGGAFLALAVLSVAGVSPPRVLDRDRDS